MKQLKNKVLIPYLWLICFAVGSLSFGLTWLLFPRERDVESFWPYAVRIVIFIIIAVGIGVFPNRFRYRYLLMSVPFFFILGYLIPRLTYFHLEDDFGNLYTYLFALFYPGIVFSVCFAYRLGGGTPGNCVKTALNGIILLFSGFLDMMWILVNQVGIPQTMDVPHIEVFIGHPPSYWEVVWFTLAHIPLLILVNVLPIDKWINWLLEPSPPRDTSIATPVKSRSST
ncbi:MAG: hypothetical protein AAGF95_03470 [Chloroflexota bacterium]